MQNDGNFVLYNRQTVIWQSDSAGLGFMLLIENSGNLAILNPDRKRIWASNTEKNSECLVLEDNGNLALYDIEGRPVWATNTTQSIQK